MDDVKAGHLKKLKLEAREGIFEPATAAYFSSNTSSVEHKAAMAVSCVLCTRIFKGSSSPFSILFSIFRVISSNIRPIPNRRTSSVLSSRDQRGKVSRNVFEAAVSWPHTLVDKQDKISLHEEGFMSSIRMIYLHTIRAQQLAPDKFDQWWKSVIRKTHYRSNHGWVVKFWRNLHSMCGRGTYLSKRNK